MNEELKKYCLVPECKEEHPNRRGMCQRHYRMAAEDVRKGIITWELLERVGAALPAKTRWNAIKRLQLNKVIHHEPKKLWEISSLIVSKDSSWVGL